VVLCATCIQVSCTKFLVRVSCTRNLDRLPSALLHVHCTHTSHDTMLNTLLPTIKFNLKTNCNPFVQILTTEVTNDSSTAVLQIKAEAFYSVYTNLIVNGNASHTPEMQSNDLLRKKFTILCCNNFVKSIYAEIMFGTHIL